MTAHHQLHPSQIRHPDSFAQRHIGPDENETKAMLSFLGLGSLEELIDRAVPRVLRRETPLSEPIQAASEVEALQELREMAQKNRLDKCYLGMGYYGTILPAVIQRNILENPGWYTQYTPYQAEISQGRMEALLNFQTMVTDLTGMEIANASMLDEATAAAEAMTMCYSIKHDSKTNAVFFVSEMCHPQTIALIHTRALPLGIRVIVGDPHTFNFSEEIFGMLLQYPGTDGRIENFESLIQKTHEHDALVVVACDLLALTLLRPPGEFGADVAVGSTQRFGMPMGYGGPHAAFFATHDEYKRHMPGRLIGISKDSAGEPALRLALQTREQHIRREKATSNICTAQVLPAVVASMYAVYHGAEKLKQIATRIHGLAQILAAGAVCLGHKVKSLDFFDTVSIQLKSGTAADKVALALQNGVLLRALNRNSLTIALDETTTPKDVETLLFILNEKCELNFTIESLAVDPNALPTQRRTSSFLTHPVFNTHHSETEMLRYMHILENRDLSLTHSMIPLGSCTMKLNATAEMYPVTWPHWANLHPFAPTDHAQGYLQLFSDLERWLSDITGFAAISLQPNAGSQGEYAGLLAIHEYHRSRGDHARDICLIPASAHGTNPASAAMVGMKVVVVKCDEAGNIDVNDLRARAEEHPKDLAACMITYPSTHGVFELNIREACAIVHSHGGLVYMDGANMNAQVGLCSPGDLGADVCHLNLHKTFCIPHGGGGPGMGPIGVAQHLASFLPTHPLVTVGGKQGVGAVSAAPWGSALILLIPWMYIRMMGIEGLNRATRYAILNANYIAKKLDPYFPVLFKGPGGFVAHECIIDVRSFKATCGIEVEDVAKRLMDYGFHAPTMSFPVPGTLMIEPTESEDLRELDRFCQAMIKIYHEIKAVETGQMDSKKNLLKMAPHTARIVTSDSWDRPYSREMAAFPTHETRVHKFWPSVGRVDNVYGDRNLFCTCAPVEEETAAA